MAKKAVTKKATTKAYNPHDSLIIQAGVLVIIISAIAIFAYVYATYGIK